MPPCAGLEQPGLRRDRAGERALLVTEQLALEERLGQRRAVDATRTGLLARRAIVDRPRHHLLADAGLAEQEHADRADRDPIDDAMQLLHGVVVDHEARSVAARRRGGRRGGPRLEHDHDVAEVERVTGRERDPLVRGEPAVADPRAVRAAQILVLDARAEPQDAVAARDRRVVELDVGLARPADHELAQRRQRVRAQRAGGDHDERPRRCVAALPGGGNRRLVAVVPRAPHEATLPQLGEPVAAHDETWACSARTRWIAGRTRSSASAACMAVVTAMHAWSRSGPGRARVVVAPGTTWTTSST